MSRVWAIFKRELAAYFRSPIGYVLFAIFLAIVGIYFAFNISNNQVDLAGGIGFVQSFLFIIIPVLTMRSFSEDRRNGTEVLLFTSPASSLEIVLGKYLASFGLFLLLTAGTLVHFVIAALYKANFDVGILGTYLGFIFLGAVYVAIGVFTSALTENQIIAAVISFVIMLSMMLLDFLAGMFGGAVSTLISKVNLFGLRDTTITAIGDAVTSGLRWLNPSTRLGNYVIGIFEVAPIVFFFSLTAVFIYLTNKVVEKRRWSQR